MPYGTGDLAGRIHVANFFFATCSGICTRLTENLARMHAEIGWDSSVRLVSFSVTPEADTGSVLLEYASRQGLDGKSWRLLTGDRKAIYSLARLSCFADEGLGEETSDRDILRTENVILVDGLLRIRGIYRGTLPLEMDKLAADIRRLQAEGLPSAMSWSTRIQADLVVQ